MKAICALPRKNAVTTEPPSAIDRFCLGTVKLGVPGYGFSAAPVPPEFDAAAFLAQVEALGIRRFDTSPRYGASEARLGAYLHQRNANAPAPWVSSKIDGLTAGNPETPRAMLASVQASLAKLHLARLDVCYLHQNDTEIILDPWVQEGMQVLKERDLIGQSGVSLYSFEECEQAIDCGRYDFVQVPVSVFDLSFYHRFIASGSHAPVRFTGRSLLLQGILANRERIAREIRQGEEILAYLQALDRIASEGQMTTLELAFRFAFSLPGIDHFLVGTLAIPHLKANMAWAGLGIPPGMRAEIIEMASRKRAWTNPRNWPVRCQGA
ncbi:MAG: aldo/keto reductase [Magnetococcales bacterium]|nr:aldo/keto reductase [Magnetococcales bacterium]